MFCNQCQETAGNIGCKVKGVCGKSETTSNLQDFLIYSLQKIAEGTKDTDAKYYDFFFSSLFSTITNANFDNTKIQNLIDKSLKIRKELSINTDQGKTDINSYSDNQDNCSLKQLLLFTLKGVSAYTHHAFVLGKTDLEIYIFLLKALKAIAKEENTDVLLNLVLEAGGIAVKAMALLDSANTKKYGNPEITKVNIGVRNNPGILISGHDLKDLELLLEQTKDQGVDVYTHSEMLAANSYPFFKKYDNLVGNYGNSWWKQPEEFEAFGGPILMTTNCIVPPKDSYKDRIFTTGTAGYEGIKHVSDEKDFSEIIELAKKCTYPKEIEKGEIIGGFAHNQVLALADKVVEAVKSGDIKRFVVMAGCDGRHKTRDYFTEVAKSLPKDTIILTAGCAKYRYNKLDLGAIAGIPRVLDAGQCNDSYSLAVIALKLKEAFGLEDINDLPVSFDIAWYEQKAVAVLLALLHLGIKGIHLGPTLPAFLAPNVAKILVENFDIKLTGEVKDDVEAIMNGH